MVAEDNVSNPKASSANLVIRYGTECTIKHYIGIPLQRPTKLPAASIFPLTILLQSNIFF